MKNNQPFLFLILIAFFASINLKAQTQIDTSYLFVYAKSGLKLRSEPRLDSETINLVKYSEAVKPIRAIDAFYSRIEGRRGKWLEVNYRGQLGYMFSVFLSKLPRGKGFANYKEEGLDYLMSLYFSTVLFQISKRDTVVLNGCEGDPDCKSGAGKISYKMNLGFYTNEYHSYEDYSEEKTGNWLFEDAVDLIESILGPSLVKKFSVKKNDGFVQYSHNGQVLHSTITLRKINEFQTSVSYGSYH